MSDEIKEIKHRLQLLHAECNPKAREEDINYTLDYITNLQQENEKLRGISYDPEETNNKWVEEESELKKVYRERDDYKSRVEKAVEYIKDSGISFLNLANQRCFCNNKCADKILNILQGEKDN